MKMVGSWCMAVVSVLVLSLSAPAAEGDEGNPDGSGNTARTSQALGEGVRAWLELQRSNRSAAPLRPIRADEATRIYERYLRSLEHPIPDRLDPGSSGVR